MLTEQEIKTSHRHITICQCTGLLGPQFLVNGFILNYIKKFNIDDGLTLLLLTFVPSVMVLILTLPLAHRSDKKGKKRIGETGAWLQVLGFALLPLVYFFSGQAFIYFLVAILIYAVGSSMLFSNWFALLDPLIDPTRRGQFFGKLRIIWQLVGVMATLLVSWLLSYSDNKEMYLGIIIVLTVLLLVRIYYYRKIPEVVKPNKDIGTMKESWNKLKQNKAYMRFCLYSFFITFLSAGLLTVFNLYEKGVLSFTEPQIVTMGLTSQLGALAGYWGGGLIVDKKGSELLFNLTNILKLLIVLSFIFIKFLPIPPIISAGLLTFAFGFVFSAFGIGNTSEAFKRTGPVERSFGIGLSVTMGAAGATLASLLSSMYLTFGAGLSVSVSGFTFNHFEILLAFIAFGFLLMNFFFRFKKEEAYE